MPESSDAPVAGPEPVGAASADARGAVAPDAVVTSAGTWESLAVANVSDGVALTDPATRRATLNPAARRLLGLPGTVDLDERGEADEAAVPGSAGQEQHLSPRAFLAAAARGAVDGGTRLDVRCSGGLLRLTARTALTPSGQMVVVFSDVSPELAATEARDESRRQLQDVLDSIDASVFVKDREGRYTFVNGGFERAIGRSRSEILGKRTRDLAPREYDAGAAESQDEELFAAAQPQTDLLRAGPLTYLTTKRPLFDDGGRVTGLVGVSMDISEQADAASRDALVAAAISNSDDGIVTLDLALRVTSANPATQRITGRSLQEIVGRELWEMVPRQAEYEAAVASARAGERVELPVAPTTLPGGVRMLARNLYPMQTPDGRVVGLVIVIRDHTQAHEAERRRQELERKLEHRERLESMGQLAGGIAHDFNNALGGITLLAEDVADRLPPGSEEAEQAEQIRGISLRTAELTAQLRLFARRDEPEVRVVDLNEVVGHADALLDRTLGEHITRVLDLEPGPLGVEADPVRLEQLVVNLATNARDAMPSGGRLRITTRLLDVDEETRRTYSLRETGPHALLSVSDEGEGMSEQTRTHAFEPFFTTKARGKGTGLGLATVYGVAQRAGGGVWLYSEPGQGTVVTVALPRRTATANPESTAAPAPRAATGTERVVVVEDDAALRDVARRLLHRAGYSVDVYPDGDSFLEVLPHMTRRPDVLVTDVVLPGLSGPEVAERATAVHPTLRVVLMSGYTDGRVSGHDVEAELLAKPFSSETLVAAVRQALTGRPASR